jgi:TonB family protein
MRARVPAEAKVKVIVTIDEQGAVTAAQVASAEGVGAWLLREEALAAARQSRFHPAREGQRAVQSELVLTYAFKPDGTKF